MPWLISSELLGKHVPSASESKVQVCDKNYSMATFSHKLYDVYFLAQSLKGVQSYNTQEYYFGFNFDKDKTIKF